MKNISISLLVVLAVLLTGCSEDAVSKEQTAVEEVATENVEAPEEPSEVEEAPEPAVEEPTEVSEEVVNAFLAEYQDITNNFKDSKKIGENTYQTMNLDNDSEVDTYTTWKFTPGEAEPEKVFEKTFRNGGVVGFPMKAGDIADSFRVDDGFYVIEPLATFDESTMNTIKDGYFPFSDLRIGMTQEEASQILSNPYEIIEYDTGVTLYSGTDVSYYVKEETGLVTAITAPAEAFSDKQMFEEIKQLFGEVTEKGEYDGGEGTWHDFTLGDYEITITIQNGDDEWQALQIAKNE